MIAKIIRFVSRHSYQLRSRLRCTLIRWKYPNCQLGSGVQIGRNVQFVVSDGGSVMIGDNVCIKDNCVIVAKQGPLEIGQNSFIGWGTIICANEGVSIGDDCLIAEFVTIRDQNHGSELDGTPFRQQPMQTAAIQIGQNVWIGAKATVLAGAKVRDHSIVAAHGVVKNRFRSGVIVGGIPATVVKTLTSQPASF